LPRYSYGTTVRARLYRLHKTQRQLASVLGYSPSYISMVLSGKYPSEELRRKIDVQLKRWEEA